MSDFPNISLPDWENCSDKMIKLQEISPFEYGKPQSRPIHTVGKRQFTIGWNGLPHSEYEQLRFHFSQNVGSTFNYTHYLTSVVYTVRYMQSELPDAPLVGRLYRKLTGLVLQEA